MEILDTIEKNDLRELLTKGWMTHDAMWFFHSLGEVGIEKTNKVNSAAVDSMSQIEIIRIKNALGMKDISINSFDTLVKLATGAMSLIKADFMKFDWSVPEKNVLRWEWHKNECFAYEGIKNLGVIDQYQCAIMTRIEGWFKGLGIPYKIEPQTSHCLMHKNGSCCGQFIFDFED